MLRPIVLTILDGWGHSQTRVGNAIASAKTPNLDEISSHYLSMLLQASGTAVGMTHGEPGNSEVGHLTLGAGRVIFQYLSRINQAIGQGDFFNNPTLLEAAQHIQNNNSLPDRRAGTLHIAGLLTSGAVHAHFDHLLALIQFAKQQNLPYRLHLFTDGRDSGLKEGAELLQKLQTELGDLSTLATIIGRDFAMDRNNNWQLTETAYNLIVHATGVSAPDPITALENYYGQDITDADIPALVINSSPMQSGDAIVFFNFREDSMRQIAQAFIDPTFDRFPRILPENIYVASMTAYTESSNLHVIIPPPTIKNCLAEVLAENNKKHLHIAETEKYAHVTFFFNGLHNQPFVGETDVFIESVEKPLEHPEMRARDIADRVCTELDRDIYDVIIINFANADILAHLGDLNATIQGVQAIDTAIGLIKQKVLEKNGVMLITADHGNAEALIYKGTGQKETRHDINPVPLYVVSAEFERPDGPTATIDTQATASGLLTDVAPSILDIMQIKKPVEMTGVSLLGLLNI